MIVTAVLSSYRVRFRHVQSYETDRAAIYCRSEDDRTQLLMAFYRKSDGEAIRKARIDVLPGGTRRVVVFFPMDMFRAIHHTLQTEGPITLYANDSNDYTQVTFGTGEESVGEEEDAGWFIAW